jgi:hypothetical protein
VKHDETARSAKVVIQRTARRLVARMSATSVTPGWQDVCPICDTWLLWCLSRLWRFVIQVSVMSVTLFLQVSLMSMTRCRSGFSHVYDALSLRFLSGLWCFFTQISVTSLGGGGWGSGCNVLPYILQHSLLGRVSENFYCSRLLSIPLVINNLENKYRHMFNWAGDLRLVNWNNVGST